MLFPLCCLLLVPPISLIYSPVHLPFSLVPSPFPLSSPDIPLSLSPLSRLLSLMSPPFSPYLVFFVITIYTLSSLLSPCVVDTCGCSPSSVWNSNRVSWICEVMSALGCCPNASGWSMLGNILTYSL